MCKMLLRDIAQEQQDKYKIAQREGKTCSKCDEFKEDKAFEDVIGTCDITNHTVSKNQHCTIQ